MKKTIRSILAIVALVLVVLEVLQLLVILVPVVGNFTLPQLIEKYTYLGLYILLALDAFSYKGTKNTGYGLLFLLLALLLQTGIIEIPYEGGLLVALIYYKVNKNNAYIGLLITFIGIVLFNYVNDVLAQLFVIVGMYFYLTHLDSRYKLKRKK